MAAFQSYAFLLPFFIVGFSLNPQNADAIVDFAFKNLGKTSKFDSQLALFGNAKFVNQSVQISGSGNFSAGSVVCKKPFSLKSSNSTSVMTFSSVFVFSMAKEIGNGFRFFMFPARFPLNLSDSGLQGISPENQNLCLSVEFDPFLTSNKQRNVSYISFKLFNNWEKLQAWINYEASGKRLEVSLRKFGSNDSYILLLSHKIDLSEMWKDEDVVIGLKSSSGISSQKTSLYSWSFGSRNLTKLSHSVPMNTDKFAGRPKEERKSDCGTRIMFALIFGAVCGAITALFIVFVCRLAGERRIPVMPEVLETKVDCKR